MAAKNFGLGSREPSKAGKFSLVDKNLSFSSTATITHRWNKFIPFMEEKGIRDMQEINKSTVIEYGKELASQVLEDEISASYAQNLVSAVNTVMFMSKMGDWVSVSPTQDCGIPERTYVRTTPPGGVCREDFYSVLDKLKDNQTPEAIAVAMLAREFGLRTKEASLIDAKKALAEAKRIEQINITRGTKGGRKRKIPITSESQLQALTYASNAQGEKNCLIAAEITWAKFRSTQVRKIREALQGYGISRLHELRSAYACERYEQLCGHPAPVFGVTNEGPLGHMARIKIAGELGHGRIDVTNSYLGGRNAKSRT
ncbi:integrase domain-containing protein [Ectopseudomonas oleovorans]|jgi:integrase|uniref:integrase domain-containing protein n=1 Tax=Ectopseudomonas oleovorans TaxID=301 RepID=UPI000CF13659|nr:integrase domain-containing protein [Pseudomonas oleovorans]PPV42330.1 hypothetical protein C5L43_01970 [Pseudomonas oleovorans]